MDEIMDYDDMKFDDRSFDELFKGKTKSKKKKDAKFDFLMTEIIIATAIVFIVLVLKLIGGNVFTDCKRMYIGYFGEKTSIAQVTDAKVKTTAAGVGGDQFDAKIPYFESYKEASVALVATKETTVVNSMMRPVSGAISSNFGSRVNPITHKKEIHGGMDIAAAYGTNIAAALGGKVRYVGWDDGYGNFIIISHNSGLETLYGHCSKITAKVNAEVKKGDTIALVGSTGMSTGPHCHFEIRLNGTRLNPSWIL